MTRSEINQIYYLNKEVEMWQRRLEESRESELQPMKLTGMPGAKRNTDTVGDKAVHEADIRSIIDGLLVRIQIERLKIYEYIDSLDDSLLRQIIAYRCLSLCTWGEVAKNIGGRNTAESVRKIFDRHFETMI